METNENTNIEQLKLRLIEQILAIENIETLQEILQFFVSQKTIAEKEIATEDSETFGEKPFVVIRKYDKNAPYPKNDIPENEWIYKSKLQKNKENGLIQTNEDNILREPNGNAMYLAVENSEEIFADEKPIEELLKMLTK